MSANKILCRKGYVINKKYIELKKLIELKESLTVSPKLHEDYAKNKITYPIYEENDKFITIPRYFAENVFGKPDKKKNMKGKKKNLNF